MHFRNPWMRRGCPDAVEKLAFSVTAGLNCEAGRMHAEAPLSTSSFTGTPSHVASMNIRLSGHVLQEPTPPLLADSLLFLRFWFGHSFRK